MFGRFTITPINVCTSLKMHLMLLTSSRSFVASAIELAPKAKSKSVSAELKALKGTHKKEKATLAKLQEKLKKFKQKEKEVAAKQKAKENEKKLIEKALKPYRKLSGLNIFIQEACLSGKSLTEASKAWNNLSQSERDQFFTKAEKVNEENLKVWTPKPIAPPTSYGAFLKEVWSDSGSFKESSQKAAEEWKKLTKEQKDSYGPSQADFNAYKKAYAEWKENRIELYKKAQAAKRT